MRGPDRTDHHTRPHRLVSMTKAATGKNGSSPGSGLTLPPSAMQSGSGSGSGSAGDGDRGVDASLDDGSGKQSRTTTGEGTERLMPWWRTRGARVAYVVAAVVMLVLFVVLLVLGLLGYLEVRGCLFLTACSAVAGKHFRHGKIPGRLLYLVSYQVVWIPVSSSSYLTSLAAALPASSYSLADQLYGNIVRSMGRKQGCRISGCPFRMWVS